MIELTRRRQVRDDSIVPMINVAFLLLIFFLMAAVIAPPDPVPLSLPEAVAADEMKPSEAIVLIVRDDGALASLDGSGFVAAAVTGQSVVLRIDANTEARQLARALREISAHRPSGIQLAVAPG